MQQFTYAGYTVRYEQLHHGAVPIALAMQCDGNLVLVSRHARRRRGEVATHWVRSSSAQTAIPYSGTTNPTRRVSCVGEISTGLR